MKATILQSLVKMSCEEKMLYYFILTLFSYLIKTTIFIKSKILFN